MEMKKRIALIFWIFLLAIAPARGFAADTSSEDALIQEVQFLQQLKAENSARYREIIQSKRSKIREKMKRMVFSWR